MALWLCKIIAVHVVLRPWPGKYCTFSLVRRHFPGHNFSRRLPALFVLALKQISQHFLLVINRCYINSKMANYERCYNDYYNYEGCPCHTVIISSVERVDWKINCSWKCISQTTYLNWSTVTWRRLLGQMDVSVWFQGRYGWTFKVLYVQKIRERVVSQF